MNRILPGRKRGHTVRPTRKLRANKEALSHSEASLAAMLGIAEALNKANTQTEICEGALERAMGLPGVRAGWISMLDESGSFRLLAARNLPPALRRPGALDGACSCRRRLLAGELDPVTDILECDRLRPGAGQADAQSLRFHTSVPVWIGGRVLGVMNLVGSEGGLFSARDKENLHAVGNQLGVALERARLHEGLQRRTRELEAANAELEAFSCAVSHDLHAPLRHMEGYLRLLTEDSAGTLPPKSQRCLKVVSRAAGKMSRLIDDLLAFSRMGRTSMSETSIDLNALVWEAVRDLEMVAQGRIIDWMVQPLAQVKGDPAMVKQVLVNLLGNAAKYTGRRDVARIEVGCDGEENGRKIFFVRDNGVGFDMEYAGKLFGVFQRLHGSEFEGTGIGLANVRRIVERHGGRVWAEAAENRGATFYFTLQPSSQ